jgi:VIT1/CCC1 family predicted Fe2+/Mn2+ transporter
MSRLHTERHLVERIGWLRAAVLGANDGIISTASLILGVASAAAASATKAATKGSTSRASSLLCMFLLGGEREDEAFKAAAFYVDLNHCEMPENP